MNYLMSFKNKNNRKDFDLDMWKLHNFIKTETNLLSNGTETGQTCDIIKKLIKEERNKDLLD